MCKSWRSQIPKLKTGPKCDTYTFRVLLQCYCSENVFLHKKWNGSLAQNWLIKSPPSGTIDPIIDGQNGVCSYRPSQAHCYDHKSNEANNCDFNHELWKVARGKVFRSPRNKRAHTTTPMLNPHTAPSRDCVPGHQLPITQSTTRRPADPRHPRPKQPAREHYPTRFAPPAGNGRAYPSTQAGRPTNPGPQSRPQPRARPSQPGGTHGPYAGHQLTGRPLGSQQQGPFNLHSWRQRPNSALWQTNSPVTISYVNSVKTNVDYCLYCGDANHRSASRRHGQAILYFHVVTKGTNHVYVIIIINMIIFNRGAAKKGRHLHCVQCYLLLICHHVIRMKFLVGLTVIMPNLTNPRLVNLALLQVKPVPLICFWRVINLAKNVVRLSRMKLKN